MAPLASPGHQKPHPPAHVPRGGSREEVNGSGPFNLQKVKMKVKVKVKMKGLVSLALHA